MIVTSEFASLGLYVQEPKDIHINYPKGNFSCRIGNILGSAIIRPLTNNTNYKIIPAAEFVHLLPAFINFKSEDNHSVEAKIEVWH